MKLLLLVLLGIGLCSAYKVGNEYSFDYYSQIGMGIPEIRNQVVAVGIKAKINFQVVTESRILVKLTNVELGDYHGEVACGLRGRYPFKWNTPSVVQLLQQPFEVNMQLSGSVSNAMVVTKNEPLYVVNIKKAITHIFLMKPVSQTTNSISKIIDELISRGTHTPYFVLHGGTYFGNCDVDFTFYPRLPMPSKDSLNGSPPTDLTYVLRRSVNFESCNNKVILQRNGISNGTFDGQAGVDSIDGRSSVATYLIRGTKDNAYHVINGTSEGVTVLNPFGYKTEKLLTITNQTMNFIAEKEIQTKFVVQTPHYISKSWQMELDSPHHVGSVPQPFVNFLNSNEKYPSMTFETMSTGRKIDTSLITQFQKDIHEALSKAADTINRYPTVNLNSKDVVPFDSPESAATFHMDSVARLLEGLPLSTVESIYDTLKQDKSNIGQLKWQLYVDACAASGSGAALELLMQKLMKKEIPHNRAMTTFMTLTNNIASPEVLPSIVEYAKSLLSKTGQGKDHELFYLTTTVWVNLASTIRRVCLDRHSWRFAVPYQAFGSDNCSPKKGIDMVLPFLEEKLMNANTEQQKVVLAQVLSNLGTARTFPVLKDIIFGVYGKSHLLRTVALYGLMRYKMQDVRKLDVQNVLEPIIIDTEEAVQVRQVALVVFLTWHPEQSWWNDLASLTWQEPSETMGSFIYSTMISFSKAYAPGILFQSRYAEYAVRFAKPFPILRQVTLNAVRANYIPRDHMRTYFDWALIGSETSKIPSEFFTYLSASFGGFNFNMFDISITTRGMDALLSPYVDRILQTPTQSASKHPRDVSGGQYKDIIALLNEKLGMKDLKNEELEGSLYWRVLENIQFFYPVIGKTSATSLFMHLKEIMSPKSKDVLWAKYVNPVLDEMLVPNQFGLPMMIRLTTPTIVSNLGTASYSYQNSNPQRIQADIESNFKYMHKVVTSIRVLVPWEDKLISTGVEHFRNLNLPFKMGFKFERHSNQTYNTSVYMESNYDKEYPMIHKHNIPFTVTKRMWPGGNDKNIVVKPITVLEDNKLVTEKKVPISMKFTGIDGFLNYRGDIAFPYTVGNAVDMLRNPALLLKTFCGPTSKVYQTVLRVNFGKSQTTKMNSSLAYQWRPDLIDAQDKNDYKTMMKTNLLLTGKQTRYYEAFVKYRTLFRLPELEYDTFASVYRSPLPANGYEKSANYCLSSSLSQMPIYDVVSLKKALEGHTIKRMLKAQLQGGDTCTHKIAEFEGTSTITRRRVELLKKELSKTCVVNKQQELEMQVEPVYDTANMKISFIQDPPSVVRNYTYQLYDFARGLAFPHAYFNYMVSNPAQKIELQGTRGLGQRYWNFRVDMPKVTAIYDHVRPPIFWQRIINTGFIPTHQLTNRLLPVSTVFRGCRITADKVKTFDGVIYDYKQSPCYVVAAVNMMKTGKQHDPNVLVRKAPSGEIEAILSLPESKLTFAASKDQLMVNGKSYPLTNQPEAIAVKGRSVAVAFKGPDRLVIEIPGKMVLMVLKGVVEVYPVNMMQKGTQGGICGTYSGNTRYQFLGPQLAYYNDTKLFAQSWKLDFGNGCNPQTLVQESKQVKMYQGRYQEAEIAYQKIKKNIRDDGLEYVFLIKQRDGALCVSDKSIGKCKPGYVPFKSVTLDDVYDCWAENNAPKILRDEKSRGFIRTRVNEQQEVTTPFKSQHVLLCKKE